MACRYDGDQTFAQTQVNGIFAMDVIDGKWYVVVKGDYAGRVAGAVYDVSNSTNPVVIPTTPDWTSCKLTRRRTVTPTQAAMRRLLQAYTQAHKVGAGEGGGGRAWQRPTGQLAMGHVLLARECGRRLVGACACAGCYRAGMPDWCTACGGVRGGGVCVHKWAMQQVARAEDAPGRMHTRMHARMQLRRQGGCLESYAPAHMDAWMPVRMWLQVGGDEGRRMLVEAVEHIQALPELKHIDFGRFASNQAGAEAAAAAGDASAVA